MRCSFADDCAESKLETSCEHGGVDVPVAYFLFAVAVHFRGSNFVEVQPGVCVGCLIHLESVEVGQSEALFSVGDDRV